MSSVTISWFLRATGALVTGVAGHVLARVSDPAFLAHVNEIGGYLMDRLSEINSPLVKEVRGKGLMVALELTVDVSPVVEAGYQHGLLLVNAGTNVIRLVPPLVVNHEHVDELVGKLTDILAGMG